MINEALLVQAALGLFTVGGAWAVMRSQIQQALREVEDMRKDLVRLNGAVHKVSLQVAYLNGQLGARGIVPPSMPDELKG